MYNDTGKKYDLQRYYHHCHSGAVGGILHDDFDEDTYNLDFGNTAGHDPLPSDGGSSQKDKALGPGHGSRKPHGVDSILHVSDEIAASESHDISEGSQDKHYPGAGQGGHGNGLPKKPLKDFPTSDFTIKEDLEVQ